MAPGAVENTRSRDLYSRKRQSVLHKITHRYRQPNPQRAGRNLRRSEKNPVQHRKQRKGPQEVINAQYKDNPARSKEQGRLLYPRHR